MNRTTLTAAALLASKALGLDLDLNLDTEVHLQDVDLTRSLIPDYAPNFFESCLWYYRSGSFDIPPRVLVRCRVHWYR